MRLSFGRRLRARTAGRGGPALGTLAVAILALGCSTQGSQGDPRQGEIRFAEVGCNGCHLVNGVGGMIGPDLTHVASKPPPDPNRWRSSVEYLRESIVDPPAYLVPGFPADMPSAERLGLTQQDVDDLVAYLSGLR